jgi:hypothetical protein
LPAIYGSASAYSSSASSALCPLCLCVLRELPFAEENPEKDRGNRHHLFRVLAREALGSTSGSNCRVSRQQVTSAADGPAALLGRASDVLQPRASTRHRALVGALERDPLTLPNKKLLASLFELAVEV